MSLALVGMGTAVPENKVSQEEAAELAKIMSSCNTEQAAVLSVLYRQTGIQSRNMVYHRKVVDGLMDLLDRHDLRPKDATDPGPSTESRMRRYRNESLPLAKQAVQKALEETGWQPQQITHLVTVSCTGFYAPGFDIGLMKHFEMKPTVERTHIGFMGCHGAFNGMRVARAFIDSQPKAKVLICATELCSIHYHYSWNPKRMVGNALFADGSAAVLACHDEYAVDAWRAVANGSCLFADSEHAMAWEIGSHGFVMDLSSKVPNLIANNLRPWIDEWLAEQDLTIEEIGSWAIHPGGPRIVTSVEETLGLPIGTANVSRDVLCANGNMSSPTVLFIVERLRQQGAKLPCVALGFGPGLVAEAVLFR